MNPEPSIVEKVYEEFSVERHECLLTGLKLDSEGLIFEGIVFNSGLLSFGKEYIDCSIGNNKLYKFLNSDLNFEINYKDVKSFKFIDCKFSDDTFFNFKVDLESLIFEECIFEKRCYINNQYESNDEQITINCIKIKKTVFNKNFKLHNTLINDFHIADTDFIKNADFFKSIFESGQGSKINFNSINFHELALFGNTEFKQILQFKYVTFKGYSHFRSAFFYQGLDLEYANIEQEMNFFDIKELDSTDSKKNTSQETYRIIKYQLQKVGNTIGANKYHSLELSKRRQELPYISFDYLVLLFHWGASNHSQNWLLPLIWIFVVGFLTCWSLANYGCVCCCHQTVHIFKYLSIFNLDDCLKKVPVIFILNKVFLGYLYYQFLTAIRKDTRK